MGDLSVVWTPDGRILHEVGDLVSQGYIIKWGLVVKSVFSSKTYRRNEGGERVISMNGAVISGILQPS